MTKTAADGSFSGVGAVTSEREVATRSSPVSGLQWRAVTHRGSGVLRKPSLSEGRGDAGRQWHQQPGLPLTQVPGEGSEDTGAMGRSGRLERKRLTGAVRGFLQCSQRRRVLPWGTGASQEGAPAGPTPPPILSPTPPPGYPAGAQGGAPSE